MIIKSKRINVGIDNGMFKHGKWSKNYKNYCIDCGKQITPISKRCRSCNEIINHLGKKNPMWKPNGSTFITNDGYRFIKITDNHWKSEHTYKVEKYLNRKLRKNEVVHHIDNNRLNNRLSNLYIFNKRWLHRMFTVLVNYNVISFNVLTSNLKKVKKGKI
jgi:hypothetical protein